MGALDKNQIGTVASINLSGGGVPKKWVSGARVSRSGLIGDAQRHRKFHGGPERAVCIYSLELIRLLRIEGHPIDVGTVGENLTVEGIDWAHVVPGNRLVVGDAVALEIASFTKPCKTIQASFVDGNFVRISQKLYPGWSRVYARVITEGEIRSGDTVRMNAPPQ